MGDFGTGDDTELAVANAIRAQHRSAPIDALLTTGDNIYPDGGPEYFAEAWYRPYGWTTEENVRLVGALGNHDVERDARPVMDLLGMKNEFYETRIGPLEIIVLDSTHVLDPQQQTFVEDSLSQTPRAVFRLVVLHHPPYSCSKHKNNDEVLAAWQPAILAGDVDLVLSGHDHVYERFAPVSGTTHIVSGGGGYSLHDMGDCPEGTPELRAFAEEHHFLIVEATREELRLQAITPENQQVDVFTISR